MLLSEYSVNHSAPSGPMVIASGELVPLGIKYWLVITPPVVIRPILLGSSVNHNAPSGPTIPCGPLPLVGIGIVVIVPPVVIHPMLFPEYSTNHSAPSGGRQLVTQVHSDRLLGRQIGTYPAGVRRLELKYPWLEADKQYAASLAPA
jgi:hypothetical protein